MKYILILLVFFIVTYSQTANCVTKNDQNIEKVYLYANQSQSFNLRNYFEGYNLEFSADGIENSYQLIQHLQTKDIQNINATQNYTLLDLDIFTDQNLAWGTRASSLGYLSSDGSYYIRYGTLNNKINFVINDQVKIDTNDSHVCFDVVTATERNIVLDCHNAQTKTDYLYLFDQYQNKTTKYTFNNSVATMKRKTVPYKINDKIYLLLAWIGNKMVNQQDRYKSFIQIFELNFDNKPTLVLTVDSSILQVKDLSISDITVDAVENIYVVDERGALIQFSFNGTNIVIGNKKNFNTSLSKISVLITQNLQHIVQVVGQHYIYQINIDSDSVTYNYLLPNNNGSIILDFQTSSNLLILQTNKYYYVYKRHQTNLNRMLSTFSSDGSIFALAPRTPNLLILGLNQSQSFTVISDGYLLINNNNIVNQTITVTATSYLANKTNSTSCQAQFVLTLVNQDPKIWPKKDFNNTVTAQNPAHEVYKLDDYFAGSKLTYSKQAHQGVTLNLQTIQDITIDSDIPFSTPLDFLTTFTYEISAYYRVFIFEKLLYIQNCKYNGDRDNVNCVVFKKLDFSDKILYYEFFKTTIGDKNNIPILSYVSQQKQGEVNFIQLNSDKIFAPLQTSPGYVITDIDANERYVYVTVKNARRIYVFHNDLSTENYLLDFIISEDQIPFDHTIFYPRQTILSPTDINILIIRNLNSIIIMKITAFTQDFVSEIIIDQLSSSNSKIVMGKNSLIVIISGNSHGNQIRQYGGFDIYNPIEMRRLDIGNKNIFEPLNAFTISDGTLVAIKTSQSNGVSFLTLIKTNQPKISSILTDVPIDSNSLVIMSELQNSCILEVSSKSSNSNLNKLTHTLSTKRYYYKPLLIARASLHNKFKDTFSFDLTVISPNYILNGTKIINVYDIKSKIDPSQVMPQTIQFPTNANDDEIKKQILADKYFNGPIAKYSIECPYCGNQIKLSDHVTQIASTLKITNSKAFHYFQNQLLWTLTNDKIEVFNLNLQIVNSIDFLSNQTNFETLNWYVDNNTNIWILLTNTSDGNQFFIHATPSENKQNAQFSNLIIIDKNPGIKNAQVIKFINNKVFIHDTLLDDLESGTVHVLTLKTTDNNTKITFLNTIDYTTFGQQTALGINDFELIPITQDTNFFLSTFGNLGLGYFTFNLSDSQFVPIKPYTYNLTSNDIIQSKLIDSKNFLQLEIIQSNVDASSIQLQTVITIENGQHQLIQLNFKKTQDSFIYDSLKGITVFGKYGRETVLNWASTILNNDNNNVLLIAHQGTNNKVSLGFYDLDYTDAASTQQMFGAVEIDAQSKLSTNFAAILFKDQSYLKVVQSTRKDVDSLFSVSNISKTVSIIYKYSEPGDFKNITFIASNQYGYTPIRIPVDFGSAKKSGLAWYIILSIVLGGVILIGVGVFIGIKYRKKSATKDSLLTVRNDED